MDEVNEYANGTIENVLMNMMNPFLKLMNMMNGSNATIDDEANENGNDHNDEMKKRRIKK